MPPVQLLDTLLHNVLALSHKAQNFHWNVVGPHFGPLHKLFGKQYSDLQDAADLLAERIRALDAFPHPHNSNEGAAGVDPIPSKPPSWRKMLEILAAEHEKLGNFANSASAELASSDAASSNLLADLQMRFEKAAWMLRSHLES
jgi:starvation-inducible DNA-binding protein